MRRWLPDITSGSRPLYLKLVQELETAIHTGVFEAGTQLPPQRLLADQLGIHLNTVNRAYVEIRRRGLTESRTRRGTIVLPPHRKTKSSHAP
ncbi:GntR family transcriptional regulator [Paraburkholderia sp. RL17-337-BIB-A]|uniref:GntR family transcriptional regulator n=1 Tax=Paraburkholderia sp. RL17-337-BIB-A TaxID=3031636 RepID=UPI0038B8570D